MQERRVRVEQVESTRRRIVETAERLYARDGVFAVSNRQVSEAAGQGNNAAVGYHFGTKADLVRAVVQRHAEAMERLRAGQLRRHADSTDLRVWAGCLVRPFTDHLAALPAPTWYARFAAQLMTEPQLRALAAGVLHEAPLLRAVTDRLHECLPDLPPAVLAGRDAMARLLIVHYCAERERAGDPDWEGTALELTDAVTGLYRAEFKSPA